MARPDKRKAQVRLDNGMQLKTCQQGLGTNGVVHEITLTFSNTADTMLPIKTATDLLKILNSATLTIQGEDDPADGSTEVIE